MTLHQLRRRRPVMFVVLLLAMLGCAFGLSQPAFGEAASTDCVLSVTLSSQGGSCAVGDAGSLNGTFRVPDVPAQMIEVQACANGVCANAPFEVLRCSDCSPSSSPTVSPSSPIVRPPPPPPPPSSSPSLVLRGVYKVHTPWYRVGPHLVSVGVPQALASLVPSLRLSGTAGVPGDLIEVSGSDFGGPTTTTTPPMTPSTTPPTTPSTTLPTTEVPTITPPSAMVLPPVSDPATTPSATSAPPIGFTPRASSSSIGGFVWPVIILLIALVAVAAGGWLRLRSRLAPAGHVQARLRGHVVAAPQMQDLGDRPAWVVRFEPRHHPVAPRIEEDEVRR